MLPGVLLHVIEPPRPVDLAVDRCPGVRGVRACLTLGVHDVRDRAVFLIDDVHDAKAAERPGVERLAAGGGIEGRPVERDRPAVAARFDRLDGGVKRS